MPIGAKSQEEGLALLNAAVATQEQLIRAAFKREGRSFLGLAGVRAQRITDAPNTIEPRRAISPRVACRNKWRRIEALLKSKRFLAEYRNALASWRAGVRTVLFPVGTYLMVRRHLVEVTPAPS